MTTASIADPDLKDLANNGFCIVQDFLPSDLQEALRKDLFALRKQKHFQISKIGHDGMVQDENTPFKDVRYSETCFIGRTPEIPSGAHDEESKTLEASAPVRSSLPASPAREDLYNVLDTLRAELETNAVVTKGNQTSNMPALDGDMEELMYAYYPDGGYYRRHRDAEADSISTLRKYSFLMYLNENWNADKDGGQLRIHRDSGGDTLPIGELPNFIDVDPKSGTLVVFRSDLCPHEVVDTHRERYAIVGWFLSTEMNDEQGDPTPAPLQSQPTIHPDALSALLQLKDAAPRLAAKLKPTPPPNNSGMLGDDFSINFPGFDSPAAPPAPVQQIFKVEDPLHWKKIASFDPVGHITTLSLSSNRLHASIDALANATLLGKLTTLDLASTDLTFLDMVSLLQHCKELKHLHLGGNGLGRSGLENLKDSLRNLVHLKTLDLRYNDLGAQGASVLVELLQGEDCMWNTLFLEGNQLGDDGVAALSTNIGKLREVYLGQNNIGPQGASALAQNLKPRIKTLYVEGNRIGNEGANAFSEALEKDSSKVLEKLYADLNGIGKEESLRLGHAVNSVTMVGS